MKQVTINVYSFNELSEDAKQKAIENLSDINVNYEWWDCTYEDAKNIGLKLESFDLDRNRHAKGEFILSAIEVAANILSQHGETCDTYKTAQNFLDTHNPIFADYMDENSDNYESSELEGLLQDIEDDFLQSLCEDYSIMLQNEYEGLTGEDAIIDAIEANEYEFDEQGNINRY